MLVYIHDADVWHRDIKPSNIMISETGQLYLIDFGIAKDNQQRNLTATHTSSRMGSEYWMAPEQFQGNASALSDIYAVGLVLSSLLGSSPKMPTRAPVFPGDAPDALRKIYEKATAEEPKKRYQKTIDMLEAIETFASTLESPVTENGQTSIVSLKDETESQVVDLQEGQKGKSRGLFGKVPKMIFPFIVLVAIISASVPIFISGTKETPKLTRNLKVEVFPANTDRDKSNQITEDVTNRLQKMYGDNTQYTLTVLKGDSAWIGRHQFWIFQEQSLYNKKKSSAVQKSSEHFVKDLEAFCDGKQMVQSTFQAGLTELNDNDVYIFVGDDYQEILNCFK